MQKKYHKTKVYDLFIFVLLLAILFYIYAKKSRANEQGQARLFTALPVRTSVPKCGHLESMREKNEP